MIHTSKIKGTNDIVLRPRFQLELPHNNQIVLSAFENISKTQDEFLISRIDDHVFIKYPNTTQDYWTPQLHLEINSESDNTSRLYGLFGPRSNIWLLFMFFHFIIALAFLGFCVWGYTNWSLSNSYFLQVVMAVTMIIIWVLLYIFGRLGRHTAKPKMRELKLFMESVLKTIDNK